MSKPASLPIFNITEANTTDFDTPHKNNGFIEIAGVPEKIAFENLNHWMNNVYKWIKESNDSGILEYDSATDYAVGAIVKGSDDILYQANIANGASSAVVNPVGDATGAWLFANRGVIGTTVTLDIEPGTTWAKQMGILEKNGASLLDADYPGLLAFYGASGDAKPFGNADATHFNLPDDRGRVMRQWDHGKGVDPDAATRTDRGDGTTGDQVGTYQADEFGSHTHTIPTRTTPGVPVNISVGVGDDSTGASATTEATGGDETRMINVNKWIGVVAL